MSEDAFVGELMLVGFNWAPVNFAVCDGSLLSMQQYMALYSLIGLVYGGDGRNTFGIPDLRGRVSVGQGPGTGLTARTVGQNGGTETTTLTVNNLPAHNHLVTAPQGIAATGTIAKASIPIDASSVVHCDPTGASTGDPAGSFPGTDASVSIWSGNAGGSMNPQMVTTTASVTSDVPVSVTVNIPSLSTTMTGSNLPVNTMQPWLCVNYCIAVNGLYPPRP